MLWDASKDAKSENFFSSEYSVLAGFVLAWIVSARCYSLILSSVKGRVEPFKFIVGSKLILSSIRERLILISLGLKSA